MQSQMMQPDELLKTGEVARRYNVAPSTVRRWVNAGKIPATQLPSGQLCFSAKAVDAAMRELNFGVTAAGVDTSAVTLSRDVPLPGFGGGLR